MVGACSPLAILLVTYTAWRARIIASSSACSRLGILGGCCDCDGRGYEVGWLAGDERVEG
jgi:hypothetical protein